MKFLDMLVDAKGQTTFTTGTGTLPTNPQASVSQATIAFMGMSLDQLYALGYVPDVAFLIQHLNEWNNAWTTEILPLVPT